MAGTPTTPVAASQGWAGLFSAAFTQSRNAMVLVDERRCFVEVNGAYLALTGYARDRLLGRPVATVIVGGPLLSPAEWNARLAAGRFHGELGMIGADGTVVAVQWGASTERVTGRRLVLGVALNVSRWGRYFRRDISGDLEGGELSAREAQVVRLVALGLTGPEIADELHIAHDTVRTHVRNAMGKLRARSRAHLVAKALGDGHVAAWTPDIAQLRYGRGAGGSPTM
jgi:PAS domain S-box-containing protein